MKIITNSGGIIPRLDAHIKKFGHRPEHHLYLYLYDLEPGYEMVYFDFGNDGGIVAHKKAKRWYIVDEPLASPARRAFLFRDTLKYIFNDPLVKKIFVEEWTALPHHTIKPYAVSYSPVLNLEKLDSSLVGGQLKGLRYARNHFLKNRKVDFKDASRVPVKLTLNLLSAWTKGRTAKDEVWAPDYEKFIKNKFLGCDIKRALFLDGVLHGLSGGWRIPNSDNYYIYMDIHDYSDEYLGEFVSLDHIIEAKKLGYKYLDFGGSDKPLLNFKKKFHPEYIYKTYNFSIKSPHPRI